MSAREEDLVLVLNAGSSSLKFALFENAAPPVQTAAGAIDRIGSGQASFTLKGPKPEQAEVRATNHVSGLEYLLERLSKTIGTSTFRAVGHRVVHGGARYREPQRVDSAMLTELRRISGFDPEHLPAEIALMEVFNHFSSCLRCLGFLAGSDNGTWWERNVPSTGSPSTILGSVQPFGELSTIIGQRGRVASPLLRAWRWMR